MRSASKIWAVICLVAYAGLAVIVFRQAFGFEPPELWLLCTLAAFWLVEVALRQISALLA